MNLSKADLIFGLLTRKIESSFDRMFAANEANGWKPKQYRIVECNAGFSLEEFVPMTDGNPKWKAVAWSKVRRHMEDSMAMRQQ